LAHIRGDCYSDGHLGISRKNETTGDKISRISVFTHLILFLEHSYYRFRQSKAASIGQQLNRVKGRYIADAGMP
jgi:hypothetical protein